MLVDDNDVDNFLHRRVIESTNIPANIIIKNSGRSALEYFKDHLHDLEKLPDLLFLDIDMPIVDGLAFLFEFEEFPMSIKQKCHVIILSSSGSKYDKDRMMNNNNVDDYIVKPLTTEDLYQIEQRLFGNVAGGMN